jgi:dolichol-phosphate mannosyltransferase
VITAKIISIVIPTYNEDSNVLDLHEKIREIEKKYFEIYSFHIIFIDNASTDKTASIIKDICKKNKTTKLIVNNRNFGHIRSPYHGILQSYGDATIYMAADFQDPPELIDDFLIKWKNGSEVVFAQKKSVKGNIILEFLRSFFYFILARVTEIEIIKNATGFGIYDKKIIDQIKKINEPLPFFRGLIAELGYKIDIVQFDQPKRKKNFTKNSVLTLIDNAILGLISHSTLPLRLLTLISAPLAFLSLVTSMIFLVLKLIFWEYFRFGFAPLIISLLMMFSFIFFFFALIGEYLANLRIYLQKRPLVIEKERVNFDD